MRRLFTFFLISLAFASGYILGPEKSVTATTSGAESSVLRQVQAKIETNASKETVARNTKGNDYEVQQKDSWSYVEPASVPQLQFVNDNTSPGTHQYLFHQGGVSPDADMIPPTLESFDGMWSKLLDKEHLYYPAYNVMESATAALGNGLENYGGVNIRDVKQEYLYVEDTTKGHKVKFFAVFSDPSYINGGQLYEPAEVDKVLKFALFNEKTNGVIFNPKTKYSSNHSAHSYAMNRLMLAQLIGYLTSYDESTEMGKKSYELALQAAQENEPYTALYYWQLSFNANSADEEWQKCELAKLRAMWELNFPQARGMAYHELKWFVDKHSKYANQEAFDLLEEWRATGVREIFPNEVV